MSDNPCDALTIRQRRETLSPLAFATWMVHVCTTEYTNNPDDYYHVTIAYWVKRAKRLYEEQRYEERERTAMCCLCY